MLTFIIILYFQGKEMFPIISVIVPVYKAEKYLSMCICSILNQTFKDFELILVDDGSPDNSGKICDDYGLKDNRIRVIHQSNSGVAIARNNGIQVSKGEWITFVDADDWIEPETYDIALKTALEKKADLLQWSISVDLENQQIKTKKYMTGYFLPETDATYLEPSMCHKLISRKIICDNNIKFPEKITLSEDRYFAFLCYMHSSKNFALDNVFYHYRMTAESATHNMNEKNIEDEIYVIEQIENMSKKLGKENIWKNVLIEQKIITKNHCLILLEKPNCRLWRNVFKEVNGKVLNYGGIKKILYFFLLLHFDFIVKILLNFYKKR